MKICVVPTCKRTQRARNLCGAHYQRWVRTGSVVGPDGSLDFQERANRGSHAIYRIEEDAQAHIIRELMAAEEQTD